MLCFESANDSTKLCRSIVPKNRQRREETTKTHEDDTHDPYPVVAWVIDLKEHCKGTDRNKIIRRMVRGLID